jgi:hypothetical protein
MNEQYWVEIFGRTTGKVESRMGPHPLYKAEKIEDGAGINLDWENFSTRIVDKDGNVQ